MLLSGSRTLCDMIVAQLFLQSQLIPYTEHILSFVYAMFDAQLFLRSQLIHYGQHNLSLF